MFGKHRIPVAGLLVFLAVCSSAQTLPDERPKLKDFGSSLRRLKWDDKKKTTVEKTSSKREDESTEEDEVIRVTTNLVICDVQVRDAKGVTVTGLTPEDFVITEDAQAQTIHHFSLGSDRDVARTIVLLIDYSGSQSPFIKTSVAAAKTLVDQLGPKDLMAIVTDDVELLVDFTRDKEKLKKSLESLRKKSEGRKYGRSKQFSALMATVREAFNSEDLRPIVIFQTDGDELFGLRPSTPPLFSIPDHVMFEPSQKEPFSLRDIYHAIEKSRTSVYTVIPSRRLIEAPNERYLKPTNEVFKNLKPAEVEWVAAARWMQIAAAGAAIGGWTAYLQKPEEAHEIYAKILEDINTRYVLGYYPTNKLRDGKRRKVSIEVKGHPEYTVSGRKSYIAPEEN
ncbi:MAG TPA: VWA domain-containing protein [Pyrinomonadaceae bacterium]|nr:VWA domain-containing protein [Pyrinomonadaceae bacterium]